MLRLVHAIDATKSPGSRMARAGSLCALLLLAGAAARDASGADAVISFTCCQYTPKAVTINQGEKVTWNGDFSFHPLRQAAGPDTDTIPPGGFTNSTGSTFPVTFSDPGTYYFYCNVHGRVALGGTMRGSITVIEVPLFIDGFED
jgi:plastocyanin